MDISKTHDEFYVSWGGFQRNIKTTFADLADEKDFTDVTLVCDKDMQISAHKVVLSANSLFFKQILLRNPHQNPLIYLRNVHPTDLTALVHFMYYGEVKIKESDLQAFLKLSEELDIKGLPEFFMQPESNSYATEGDIIEVNSIKDDQDYENGSNEVAFLEQDNLSESVFNNELDKIIGSIQDLPTKQKNSVSSYADSDIALDNLLLISAEQKYSRVEKSELSSSNIREAKYSISSSGCYSEVEENQVIQESPGHYEDISNEFTECKTAKRRSISHFFGRSRSKDRKSKRTKSSVRLTAREDGQWLSSCGNLTDSEIVTKNINKVTCRVCEKSFRYEDALAAHMKKHKVESVFECDNCEVKCETKETLHRHMELKDHYTK